MKFKFKKPKLKIKSNFDFSKIKSKIKTERFNSFWVSLKDNSIFKRIFSTTTLKIIIFICFFVGVIQVIFAILIYGYRSDDKFTRAVAKVIPYPAAIVNQSIVTYDKYLTEKDYVHHFYESTQQEGLDWGAIDKEILNQLVENKLIAYQAWKNNIKISNKDVQESLDQIVEQNGGEEKVAKILDELYGLSLNQFKNLIKQQLLRDKLNNELIMKVTARHILVRVDKDAPQEKVDEAKAKIDGYLTEINSGLDFGEAAQKYSEDTGSAENEGLLEPFSDGEMVEEFSNAAFSGEAGKIIGPVRTDFGWHIIKIEDKTGKIQKSFPDWLSDLQNKSHSLIIKLVK